jgi:hypothetical protein
MKPLEKLLVGKEDLKTIKMDFLVLKICLAQALSFRPVQM